MTRREFAAGIAGAVCAASPSVVAQTVPVIDQNPIRRRGVGLRGLDAARASAGLTLFAPMLGDGTVYLIDLRGKIVHQWRMPYPPGLYGYFTEKGTLFYNGKIPNDSFLGEVLSRAVLLWKQTGMAAFYGKCVNRIIITMDGC